MIANKLLLHSTVAISTHFCITNYEFIEPAVSCCLAHTLSVREVWDSNPGSVKWTQCRHRCDVNRTCVAQALSRGDAPPLVTRSGLLIGNPDLGAEIIRAPPVPKFNSLKEKVLTSRRRSLEMARAAKRPANEPLTGLFTGPLEEYLEKCIGEKRPESQPEQD